MTLNRSVIASPRRFAVTLLEVLFATIVIVIGLLGIATLIPFAARDAQTANNHNQGVSLGLAWAETFFARGLHSPNGASAGDAYKWVWFRDYGGASGWERYSRAGYSIVDGSAARIGGVKQSSANSTVSAGGGLRIWGHIPVCIDPFVHTSDSGLFRIDKDIDAVPLGASRPRWFRESVFPYFDESYDPAVDPYSNSVAAGFPSNQPRMLRISLAFSPSELPGYLPRRNAPVSNKLVSNLFASLDDQIEDSFTEDASKTDISDDLPARRLFGQVNVSPGVDVLSRPLLNNRYTWKATVVPTEPIPSDIAGTNADLYAETPAKNALVSFLVLHRHNSDYVPYDPADATIVPLPGSTEDKPKGERMVRVYPLSGNFTGGAGGRVRIIGNANVDNKIEIGDWILLGRDYLVDSSSRKYSYFRWFRIIGVSPETKEGDLTPPPAFPFPIPNDILRPRYEPNAIDQFGNFNSSAKVWARDVVLDGPDFAFGEYPPNIPANGPQPTWWPSVSPTTGTLVSGVVTVVERRIQLN